MSTKVHCVTISQARTPEIKKDSSQKSSTSSQAEMSSVEAENKELRSQNQQLIQIKDSLKEQNEKYNKRLQQFTANITILQQQHDQLKSQNSVLETKVQQQKETINESEHRFALLQKNVATYANELLKAIQRTETSSFTNQTSQHESSSRSDATDSHLSSQKHIGIICSTKDKKYEDIIKAWVTDSVSKEFQVSVITSSSTSRKYDLILCAYTSYSSRLDNPPKDIEIEKVIGNTKTGSVIYCVIIENNSPAGIRTKYRRQEIQTARITSGVFLSDESKKKTEVLVLPAVYPCSANSFKATLHNPHEALECSSKMLSDVLLLLK